MASASDKTKILIIGGTGYIGEFVVSASARLGHLTFALVRDLAPVDPAKAKLLKSFKDSGVTLVKGDLYDHGSLVNAIKAVDVVISTVGSRQIADQTNIIAAIKEAGNVKRFIPSEFGNDADLVHAVEPAKSMYTLKASIRRAIEAAGIPYTYVAGAYFAGYFLPTLCQLAPPIDKVIILGDGNTPAVFADEGDIGTYTIKAVDDPRTLNKSLYLRPVANTITKNDLVSLYEKITGKKLERIYVTEEQLLKQIQESPYPVNIILSLHYSVFIKGDQTNFKIEPSFGVEATELYPQFKYTTVEELIRRYTSL
ncbi:isoflavone reductase-like protein [Carex littledalei]|uniref:Isoflavone reductase-like protein n=1 Tax=Carex littledalei TaxID=544730 RepID=A0A833R9B5_9POAL|nr:isoflavone reductase-like protein [Carex littledalei]